MVPTMSRHVMRFASRSQSSAQRADAAALEFRERDVAAARGEQDRLAGPADFGAFAVRPIDVGGHQPEAGDAFLGADESREPWDEIEGRDQAIARDGAGHSERTAD